MIEGSNRLVECVPNFSEGRDAATVDAIARVVSDTLDVLRWAGNPMWITTGPY